MPELKIDQAAVDALVAKVQSRPAVDAEDVLAEAIKNKGTAFDDQILYIGDYCCVYTIETATQKGITLDHVSISQRGNAIPPDVVEQIAEAFGLGKRSTWTLEIPLPLGHNVIKLRTN